LAASSELVAYSAVIYRPISTGTPPYDTSVRVRQRLYPGVFARS